MTQKQADYNVRPEREDSGTTHHDGCYSYHFGCALRHIGELENENGALSIRVYEAEKETARLKNEVERLNAVINSDHWYKAAMMYLKSLQELRTVLKIIRGNAEKGYDIANGKEV